MNYARRCKFKDGHEKAFETFETLHGVDDNYKSTLCGKELSGMWFVESNAGLEIEDITCKKCIRQIKINNLNKGN